MDKDKIIEVVGEHNHYFRIGVFEAENCIQERLDAAGLDGYKATVSAFGNVPEKAVVVGSVKVHSGDKAFPLYVIKVNVAVATADPAASLGL